MRTGLKNLPTGISNFREHQPSEEWFVVDWGGEYFKKRSHLIPQGEQGCCVYPFGSEPEGADSYAVKVRSFLSMEMCSLDFPPNAWGVERVGQCDALLFPNSDQDGDALLFVEIKYSLNDNSWKKYKRSALCQIVDTMGQLEYVGCPIKKRNVFGLISCPLVSVSGATVYSLTELRQVYEKHQLQLYMGNTVTFLDTQTVTLSQ